MERTWRAAGVPQKILDLVPAILDTCRECRAWASSKADITPSVELTTKPEQVEGDILFYKRHAIWHMVDRCDRWHAAEEIQTKEFASIRRAIENCWIKIYGAPKYLVVDGEGAIAHAGGEPTAEAAEFLKHHGITPRIRAPDQHARMIERRGAILRHSMHTCLLYTSDAADEE